MNETVKSPADEPVPANGAGMDGQTSDPAATERDGFAVIEALNTENAALKDRMLRTLAEMENLRRRTEREVADAKNYGVTNLARDMLNVADNLARALEHIPAEVRANADGEFKSLIEGVELTARDLTAALGRREQALDWLENAVNRGFINYTFLICDPFLNNIRGEERFKKLTGHAKYEWEHFEVPE